MKQVTVRIHLLGQSLSGLGDPHETVIDGPAPF
jgi:hypothetical protein